MLKAVIFNIAGILDSNFHTITFQGINTLLISLDTHNVRSIFTSSSDIESYRHILKEIKLTPDDCILITDTTNGCNSAKHLQLCCIGFLNKTIKEEDLNSAFLLLEGFEEVDYTFLDKEYRHSKGLPVTILTTERLHIRELSMDNIRSLYQTYQNPDVRAYIDDFDEILEVELDKHQAYIKNVYAFYGYGLWGVFSKNTNTLIGRAGIQNALIEDQTEIELSYSLDVNHWGNGYALECAEAILSYSFRTLEISSIVAAIDTFNSRSIRVAERIGMYYEKEINYRNRNCRLYRITTDSFKRQQAKKSVLQKIAKKPDNSVYAKRYE